MLLNNLETIIELIIFLQFTDIPRLKRVNYCSMIQEYYFVLGANSCTNLLMIILTYTVL